MPRTSSSNQTLGADVRALRKSRCSALAKMVARFGRSVGRLSGVEQCKSAPSIDLRSGCLGHWATDVVRTGSPC